MPSGHSVPIWQGATSSLLWPCDAWIHATDVYWDDRVHTGSADLNALYHTPVYASGPGIVEYTRFAGSAGFSMRIIHDGERGEHYRTYISHLADWPVVEADERVEAGQLIGHLGTTGRVSSPHVHFTLRRYTMGMGNVMLGIPIQRGQWAEGFIPGAYRNTPSILQTTHTFDAISVCDVEVTETPYRDSTLYTITEGTIVTVEGSQDGMWHIADGWVPMSAFKIVGDTTEYGRVHSQVVVREGPGASNRRIGLLRANRNVVTIGHEGNWRKVLWGVTPETNSSDDPDDTTRPIGGHPNINLVNKWGYIAGSFFQPVNPVTYPVPSSVPMYSTPGGQNQVGQMGWGIDHDGRILEVENGYYLMSYGGVEGWVAGWLTGGPYLPLSQDTE